MKGFVRVILFRLCFGCLLTGSSIHGFSQADPADNPFAGIPLPQLGPNDTIPVPAEVHEGEWTPVGNLDWVWVSARYPKRLLKKRQEWTRLRNAVYVTYPYARKAGYIINDINRKLSDIPDKGDRRK